MQVIKTDVVDTTILKFETVDYMIDTYAVEDGGINVIILNKHTNIVEGLATIWIQGERYDYILHLGTTPNSILEQLCEYIIEGGKK